MFSTVPGIDRPAPTKRSRPPACSISCAMSSGQRLKKRGIPSKKSPHKNGKTVPFPSDYKLISRILQTESSCKHQSCFLTDSPKNGTPATTGGGLSKAPSTTSPLLMGSSTMLVTAAGEISKSSDTCFRDTGCLAMITDRISLRFIVYGAVFQNFHPFLWTLFNIAAQYPLNIPSKDFLDIFIVEAQLHTIAHLYIQIFADKASWEPGTVCTE